MNEVFAVSVVHAIRSNEIKRMFVALGWDSFGWGFNMRPAAARLANIAESIMWGLARPAYGPN